MQPGCLVRALFLLATCCFATFAAQTNGVPPPRAYSRTNAATATATTPGQRPVPFRGTIKSVDKTAQTFVIGARTFVVTPRSKLLQADKPVPLTEALVGEWVTGSYLRTSETKLPVLSLYVGGKSPAAGSPNAKARTPQASSAGK